MVKLQQSRKGGKDGNVLNNANVKLRGSIVVRIVGCSIVLQFLQDHIQNGRKGSQKDELHSKDLALQQHGICQCSWVVLVWIGLIAPPTESNRGRQMIGAFGEKIHHFVTIALSQDSNTKREELINDVGLIPICWLGIPSRLGKN